MQCHVLVLGVSSFLVGHDSCSHVLSPGSTPVLPAVQQRGSLGATGLTELEVATVRQEDVRRVLEQPISQDLLTSANLARIAYTGVDGYPRAVPVGYW
jgi:hypothetical protein